MAEAPGAQDDDGATGRVVARVKEGTGEEEEEEAKPHRRASSLLRFSGSPHRQISSPPPRAPTAPSLSLPLLVLSLSQSSPLPPPSLVSPYASRRFSHLARVAVLPEEEQPYSPPPAPRRRYLMLISHGVPLGASGACNSLSPHVNLRPRPNQRPYTTAHAFIQNHRHPIFPPRASPSVPALNKFQRASRRHATLSLASALSPPQRASQLYQRYSSSSSSSSVRRARRGLRDLHSSEARFVMASSQTSSSGLPAGFRVFMPERFVAVLA
ncbi:hypothetical protein HETIRDRAFT_101651 [Heterobasidion irregulare TC 32-1]|uniref:Uncharacterized protein n=1 Tax=Heterobasidion irregulare (strain TC 32-1) TaxID=747525 RepID=W4K3W8_HETIT|nr:uncharacterized protein HETIRDRAFT_101651 [Heterobasidion irregulare TC 32-1]ETW80502.1 hypothetical protein HETIRDRAFT_101651 [Heterobasidion irregulare TC 32-1]